MEEKKNLNAIMEFSYKTIFNCGNFHFRMKRKGVGNVQWFSRALLQQQLPRQGTIKPCVKYFSSTDGKSS